LHKKVWIFLWLILFAVVSFSFTFVETYDTTLASPIMVDPMLKMPFEYQKALVIRAVDGDTVVVFTQNATETVRLIGVDTPETHHPKKPVEYFGPEAAEFTKIFLRLHSVVFLTFDKNKRDVFGRLLAYIWVEINDELYNFNEILILNGYGRAYTKYKFRHDYMEIFTKAEDYAKSLALGMWK